MLVKHSTLFDRYARGVPILGLAALYYQAIKHFEMAKEDDLAFVKTMQNLDTPFPEHLRNHNLVLERVLVVGSMLSLAVSWYFSYILLGHINVVFLAFLAMCNAICLDYIVGQILLKAFNRIRLGKTN
jgi:hypothetical protein